MEVFEQAYIKVAQTENDQEPANNMSNDIVESGERSEQAYIKVVQSEMEQESASNEPISIGDHVGKEEIGEQESRRGIPVILGIRARLWTSLVHVVPLGFSAFVVYMNFSRWYWFGEIEEEDPGIPSSMITNMLQFVAKLHELLVITSLGALTIKAFKRHLVESHLPLGLLTGAYRVGDVPYIFSSTFWSALSSSSALLALLVAVNTIVATLVGPASAILLVPELGWFPFPDAFSKIQLPIFYNRSVEETWPRVVSGSTLNRTGELSGCDSFDGWYAYRCPGAGFPELWNWISGWKSSSLETTLTSQDPTGAVRRRILSEPWSDSFGRSIFGGSSASYATAVSMASLVTIGRLLNFIKEKSDDDNVFSATENVKFKNASDSGYLASFYAPSADETHPLLAVAEFPYVNGSEAGVWVIACSIMAHWIPTVLTVSPSENDFVESNVTDFEPFRSGDVEPPAADVTLPNGTVAKTTKIERLLSSWMATRILGNTSVIAFDPGSDTEGGEYIIFAARHTVQTFFGSIVADALSRVASSSGSYAVLSRNDTTIVVTDLGLQQTSDAADTVYEWPNGRDAAPNITGAHRVGDGSKMPQQLLDGFHQLTIFDFEAEKYGYGSGKVGSTTRFAYSVMFIYFALVGGYFLYVMVISLLCRGKPVPTVRGWDDVQELIVLAWNSKLSPKLGRSSVVTELTLWEVQVGIRADTTGRTQLTTGAPGLEKLRRGEMYH
ncbi:hypothetical protein MFIFM68171_09188 [Madurella fahalii]|uniref:Uncharacterized protein n=1 Tax=Madurella fahalii TaxID=1157608 RepID=A0ABQ0GMK0_9PEZI